MPDTDAAVLVVTWFHKEHENQMATKSTKAGRPRTAVCSMGGLSDGRFDELCYERRQGFLTKGRRALAHHAVDQGSNPVPWPPELVRETCSPPSERHGLDFDYGLTNRGRGEPRLMGPFPNERD